MRFVWFGTNGEREAKEARERGLREQLAKSRFLKKKPETDVELEALYNCHLMIVGSRLAEFALAHDMQIEDVVDTYSHAMGLLRNWLIGKDEKQRIAEMLKEALHDPWEVDMWKEPVSIMKGTFSTKK